MDKKIKKIILTRFTTWSIIKSQGYLRQLINRLSATAKRRVEELTNTYVSDGTKGGIR